LKIVLLGKDGQVGWELQRALAPLGDVVALGRGDGDLREPDAIAAKVRAVAPQWIVNAAAYTAVDRAESESDLAQLVNATAVGALARAAHAANAWLVHFSSDYVFDGSGEKPWREDDPTAPLGAYGRSKLAGEELVRASRCRHLILRTSWVFAARGTNFVRTMLRLGAERDEVAVVDDQHGSPTYVGHLAAAVRELLDLPRGRWHLASGGDCTWAELAEAIFEEAGIDCRVRRISTVELERPAPRPAYSVLRSDRAEAPSLPHWRDGLRACLRRLLR
jgi:dTDP-4-dehydrorhamnose reductase